MLEPVLTHSIIGAFYEVYNQLGYGFSESVYTVALERELVARGHRVAREVSVRIWYKGNVVARQRLDMLVGDKIIVEVKAGALLAATAIGQLTSYLKASRLEVGLLLHFGPKPRFHRVIFTH